MKGSRVRTMGILPMVLMDWVCQQSVYPSFQVFVARCMMKELGTGRGCWVHSVPESVEVGVVTLVEGDVRGVSRSC